MSSYDQKDLEVSISSCLLMGSETEHCVHLMILAPNENVVFLEDTVKARAAVFMQMRFDGYLGFPGGMVDEPLSGLSEEEAKTVILDALNRELEEEVNSPPTLKIKDEDYLYSQRHSKGKNLFCHFYTCQVTLDQFRDLEVRATEAHDYGDEVMGNMRVPLYTMKDGYRGFPSFLQNKFIGPSKSQLISGLLKHGIFNKEEIDVIVEKSINGLVL